MESKLREELRDIGQKIKDLYMEDKARIPLNDDRIKELLGKMFKLRERLLKEYGKKI